MKQNSVIERLKIRVHETLKKLDCDVFSRLKTVRTEIDKQSEKISMIDELMMKIKTAPTTEVTDATNSDTVRSLKQFLTEQYPNLNQYEDFPSSFANLIEPEFPFEFIERSDSGRSVGTNNAPVDKEQLVKYKDTYSTYDNRSSNFVTEFRANTSMDQISLMGGMFKNSSKYLVEPCVSLKGPFEGSMKIPDNCIPVHILLKAGNCRKFYYLAMVEERATAQHLFDKLMATVALIFDRSYFHDKNRSAWTSRRLQSLCLRI